MNRRFILHTKQHNYLPASQQHAPNTEHHILTDTPSLLVSAISAGFCRHTDCDMRVEFGRFNFPVHKTTSEVRDAACGTGIHKAQ